MKSNKTHFNSIGRLAVAALPLVAILLLPPYYEARAAVFADYTSFQTNSDPEFATGQIGDVGFRLECTFRRDGQGSGIGNGGIVPFGTLDGTSTIFNSTNFTPPLVTGDSVALGGASDFRLTFDRPVTDLTLHLFQLANNKLSFTWGDGTPAAFRLLSSDGYLTPTNVSTAIKGRDSFDNASGSMLFAGTFSELRWTSDHANVGDGFFLQLSVRTDLRASIRVSFVDICWAGTSNWLYQVQYASVLTSNQWFNLGAPVAGNGSNCVTEAVTAVERRFYRVVDAQ